MTVLMRKVLEKIWGTKCFATIGGDCDTDRSKDLHVLPYISFQSSNTVDKGDPNSSQLHMLTGLLQTSTELQKIDVS